MSPIGICLASNTLSASPASDGNSKISAAWRRPTRRSSRSKPTSWNGCLGRPLETQPMRHVTLRYERAKLYEEIWEEPVTTVAKRNGVSDVALRKICKQLAVPL